MNIYNRIEEKKTENKTQLIIIACVCVLYIIVTNL